MLALIHVVDDDSTSRWLVQEILVDVDAEVRAYDNPRDFLKAYRASPCECLVTDLRMPGMSGLDLQEHLLGAGETIPIIFMSAYSEIAAAVAAVKRGAVDFLEKPLHAGQLREKVEAALALSRVLHSRRMVREERGTRLAVLTDREREVLELVLVGSTSREIAARLSLSPRTVENHRAHVMEKLDVTSAVELVRLFG